MRTHGIDDGKLDVKNAFDSLPRAHMFDAIMDRWPSVVRLL